MPQPAIVVGVTPWQPDAVVHEAVKFAAKLHCRVVCVSVDLSRYVTETRADGSIIAASIDSDAGGVIVEEFDPGLADRIRQLAATADVECEFVASAGNPGRVLTKVANEHDAVMIVVGTRSATFGGTVREFFSGSVAVNLAHRQHRPVLVVPLDPASGDGALPWDGPRPVDERS